MQIPFSTVERMHSEIRAEMRDAYESVCDSGWFIHGKECAAFEAAFARYCGADHCVGIGNGLDAIMLILRAIDIGPGDEVILPAHTFIATALAISYAGATPVLCDIDPESFNMDPDRIKPLITKRTRAILPVHLYGRLANMTAISALAKEHGLRVIEDAAQAHGAELNGRIAGNLADAAAFSFYPGKNLGALGDGGAVTTVDDSIAQKVRTLANYGSAQKYHHDCKGVNSRLDELQSAFLSVKLRHLDDWTKERQGIAKRYLTGIQNPFIQTPQPGAEGSHVWHIFALRCERRDALQKHLADKGIGTLIHYPIPIHLQQAYRELPYNEGDFPAAEQAARTVLSLSLFNGMTEEEIDYVIDAVDDFQG